MKKPLSEEQERSLSIRKRGKRGEYISREDAHFNMKVFKNYSEWYEASEAIVFNEITLSN